MLKLLLMSVCICSIACNTTYYIVRHAEKEPVVEMTGDVLLSEEGRERAQALRDSLLRKDVKRIFSTNTLRTVATAQPLSEAINISVELYDTADFLFVNRLKQIRRGSILVVGHSNTVDDLVNGLTGQRSINSDLPDTSYGDLFIVKRRNGKYYLKRKQFGE